MAESMEAPYHMGYIEKSERTLSEKQYEKKRTRTIRIGGRLRDLGGQNLPSRNADVWPFLSLFHKPRKRDYDYLWIKPSIVAH